MKKVIFIVGLPCCGKSALGLKLVETVKNSIFFDDVDNNCMDHIKSMTDKYDVIILSTELLCLPKARENAIKYFKGINSKVQLEWRYFDYNVNACIKRAPEKIDYICEVAQHYEIPARKKKIGITL